MNSEYLSDFQLKQVSAILKKYGIESDDLLDELTDHYAGLIEEKMDRGASFDEAFGNFVSENSWFKLRKLQHAHWKYSEKSLLRFVWQSLKSLYSFPRIIATIAVALMVFYTLKLDTDWSRSGLVAIHIGLILHTLAVFTIALINRHKHKIVDVGYAAQVSLSIFYAMMLPTWVGEWSSWSIFNPVIPADVGVYVQSGYYFLIIHLAYLHHCIYRRAMAKTNRLRILG